MKHIHEPVILTNAVPYFSAPLGHCDVISMSTPLNFVSLTTGLVSDVISIALKFVLSDTMSDSVPLRYANCRPELPVYRPFLPSIRKQIKNMSSQAINNIYSM